MSTSNNYGDIVSGSVVKVKVSGEMLDVGEVYNNGVLNLYKNGVLIGSFTIEEVEIV